MGQKFLIFLFSCCHYNNGTYLLGYIFSLLFLFFHSIVLCGLFSIFICFLLFIWILSTLNLVIFSLHTHKRYQEGVWKKWYSDHYTNQTPMVVVPECPSVLSFAWKHLQSPRKWKGKELTFPYAFELVHFFREIFMLPGLWHF